MKSKTRWPPMEANFLRQFQSPTRTCTSVLFSHATFYIFWRVFFGNTHKTCLQKIEMSLRISNIFRQSQTELQVIYFHENKLPNWQETWSYSPEKLLEESTKCTSFCYHQFTTFRQFRTVLRPHGNSESFKTLEYVKLVE